MTLEQKVRNSINAYVLGDAMGVPFEFRRAGTFKCLGLSGNGTHDQPKGTWSDATSILLCILDSLTRGKRDEDCISIYKQNLREFLDEGKFTVDGRVFDVGFQTRMAILSNFTKGNGSRVGNGALFYSLPLAFYLLPEERVGKRRDLLETYCRVTHDNDTCVEYSFKLSELARERVLGVCDVTSHASFRNSGDVINTYNLVAHEYDKLSRINKPVSRKLCDVVNLGNDTDTNAALTGGLLGLRERVQQGWLKQLRGMSMVEEVLNSFILHVS